MKRILPVVVLTVCAVALRADEKLTTPNEPAPRIVAGHVTRADDGSPVVGARIYMKQTGPAVTDTNGFYELRHHLDGYRSIWINAKGLSIINRKIDVSGKDRVDEVDFVLEPSYQIRGRVVDEQGNPVADARVYISDDEEFQTIADAGGNFHLDTMMARRPKAISAESPDCDEFVELDNPPHEAGTLVLCRRSVAVLAGVVLDAQGNAAKDIRVWLCPKNDGESARECDTTTDGRFRFPVPGGSYDLLVYNWQQTQVALLRNARVAENERKTDLVIQLTDRPEVRGRVASNHPKRFARKELTLTPVDLQGLTCHPYWFYESALTDEAGRFQVRQLLPGRYQVELFGDLRRREAVLTQTINVTEQTTEIVLDGNEPDVERQ